MQPLSAGNVISASMRLYGNHLKQYLLIAVIAAGWSILPTIVSWGLQLIFFRESLAELNSANPGGAGSGLMALIRLGTFILAIYCSAQYYLNLGLISRLAFAELIEKPEPTSSARRQLKPMMFRFLVTQILVGLLIFAVGLGVGIVWFIASMLVAGIFGSQNFLGGIISLILLLVAVALVLWAYGRWFIAEVPLAVEEEASSTGAIGRSWSLTKGYATRILIIILVGGLITLPLYLVAFIPFLSALFAVVPLAAQSPNDISSMAGLEAFTRVMAGFGLSFLLVLAFNTFVVPFWQAIKSLIYFDLRNRQEGLGLQLRDRTP
jgi:hypothetical protein